MTDINHMTMDAAKDYETDTVLRERVDAVSGLNTAFLADSTSGMVLDGLTLRDVLAGDARFTVTILRANDAKMIGTSFTYRITRYKYFVNDEEREGIAVRVLTGADNERAYTYAGMLSEDGTFRLSRGSKMTLSAPSVKLLVWLTNRMRANQDTSAVEILAAGRCLRCGRMLTRADSIRARYGRVCAKNMGY